MSEMAKTGIYLAGAAVVAALAAFFTVSGKQDFQAPDQVGKALFEEQFSEPDAATSLKITKFDSDRGQLNEFEVTKDSQTGQWVIPSHGNFPADAEDQMEDAASALVDLRVLGVATEVQEDHETYGVVEPNKDKISASDKGVGTLLVIKDGEGNELAQLIVGEKVQGADDNTTSLSPDSTPSEKEKRFVRLPGQDPVYVVELDMKNFSTKFDDWIERDLLDLSSLDIDRVQIKDYTVLPNVAQDYRMDATMSYDGSNWKLNELLTYKNRKPVKTDLLSNEELNSEKLNELKSAVNELEIVDVLSKPAGMTADLEAGSLFLSDDAAVQSLAQQGFYTYEDRTTGKRELKAQNGEVLVGTKDGAELILRFGSTGTMQEDDSDDSKIVRYLFVMARADESRFPKPVKAPYPDPNAKPAKTGKEDAKDKDDGDGAKKEPPKKDDGTPDKDDEANKKEDASTPPKKKDEVKKDEAKTDEAKTDEAKKEPAKKDDASTKKEEAESSKADAPAKKNDADGKKEEAKKDTAKSEDAEEDCFAQEEEDGAQDDAKDAASDKTADKEADDDDAKSDDAATKAKDDALQAEKDRIDREYQQKLDDWEENRRKMREKVVELNSRFSNWYFVVEDDVYKKIRLSRFDIIRETESFGVDAFRELEEKGLSIEPPPAPPAGGGFTPPGGGFRPPGL